MVVLNPAFGSFERFKTVIAVWLGLSAACDIVIAAGMSYALVRLVCFAILCYMSKSDLHV